MNPGALRKVLGIRPPISARNLTGPLSALRRCIWNRTRAILNPFLKPEDVPDLLAILPGIAGGQFTWNDIEQWAKRDVALKIALAAHARANRDRGESWFRSPWANAMSQDPSWHLYLTAGPLQHIDPVDIPALSRGNAATFAMMFATMFRGSGLLPLDIAKRYEDWVTSGHWPTFERFLQSIGKPDLRAETLRAAIAANEPIMDGRYALALGATNLVHPRYAEVIDAPNAVVMKALFSVSPAHVFPGHALHTFVMDKRNGECRGVYVGAGRGSRPMDTANQFPQADLWCILTAKIALACQDPKLRDALLKGEPGAYDKLLDRLSDSYRCTARMLDFIDAKTSGAAVSLERARVSFARLLAGPTLVDPKMLRTCQDVLDEIGAGREPTGDLIGEADVPGLVKDLKRPAPLPDFRAALQDTKPTFGPDGKPLERVAGDMPELYLTEEPDPERDPKDPRYEPFKKKEPEKPDDPDDPPDAERARVRRRQAAG